MQSSNASMHHGSTATAMQPMRTGGLSLQLRSCVGSRRVFHPLPHLQSPKIRFFGWEGQRWPRTAPSAPAGRARCGRCTAGPRRRMAMLVWLSSKEQRVTFLFLSLERASCEWFSWEERLGLVRGRTRRGWGGKKKWALEPGKEFLHHSGKCNGAGKLWQRQMLLVAQLDFFHRESITLNIWSILIFQCLGSF